MLDLVLQSLTNLPSFPRQDSSDDSAIRKHAYTGTFKTCSPPPSHTLRASQESDTGKSTLGSAGKLEIAGHTLIDQLQRRLAES